MAKVLGTKNLWQNFPVQLTKWMSRKYVDKFTETFYKYHGKNCEGKCFMIKNSKNGKKVAVFIRRENLLRRHEDIKINMRLSDFLLMNIKNKREGISIFQETLRRI